MAELQKFISWSQKAKSFDKSIYNAFIILLKWNYLSKKIINKNIKYPQYRYSIHVFNYCST